MKKRIWELDAMRGLFIIGMVVVHLIYDIQTFADIPLLENNVIYDAVANWGGVLFFLISGICVTLGSRPVRRGLIVLGCGIVVSAVTFGMYALDMAGKSMIIFFGVLHCLGMCMLLWPLLKKCHWGILAALAVGIIPFGIWLDQQSLGIGLWLIIFGFTPKGFSSSDYFPLLPFLGFFLVGAVLGKTLYRKRETLFPKISADHWLIRMLSWIGKWSLLIYMLHQPVLAGISYLLGVVL